MKPLFLKKLISGAVVATAVWGGGALLLSFVAINMGDPKSLLGVFSAIILITGAFIGAKVARPALESRPLSSLLSTVSALLPYFVGSLIISGAISPLKMLIVFISAFMGAFIDKSEKKHTSSKRLRKSIASRYAGR